MKSTRVNYFSQFPATPLRFLFLAVIAVVIFAGSAMAEQADDPTPADDVALSSDDGAPQASPWLLVPMVSSDPKVGTSGGAMVGYLFKIDEESTSSMVGVGGTYSTTDSLLATIYLRTFWDQDKTRFILYVGGGTIENDYEDFLGSGLPAQTTDDMRIVQARYLQKIRDRWFGGIKVTYTNYAIWSEDGNVNEALESLGLTGIDSVALGLVGMYDSRNNQNTPTSGIQFNLENFAYREAFGGEEDFDTYQMRFNQYIPHGDNNVLAYRVNGRWTSGAEPGGYSSVNLRGYTRGQYLAPHSTMVEFEERIHITGRYGVNIFAGLACLYGDGLNCFDSENMYPSGGVGGQILLNEAEKMSMTFDFAMGKSGNNGFYMRFGQSF